MTNSLGTPVQTLEPGQVPDPQPGMIVFSPSEKCFYIYAEVAMKGWKKIKLDNDTIPDNVNLTDLLSATFNLKKKLNLL